MPEPTYLDQDGLALLWSRIREKTTALQTDVDDTNDRVDDLDDEKLDSVSYDSTHSKIVQNRHGTSTDVVSVATIKSAMGLTKADVGLGNVEEDAQENVIEKVKLNGTELVVNPTDKSVNVTVVSQENVIEKVKVNGTELEVDPTDKSVDVTFTSQENVIEKVKLNGTELPVDSTDKSVNVTVTSHENVIEKVKVNGTELTVDPTDKSVNVLIPDQESIVPINHASSGTTYGVGTNTLYGHVKLSDAITDTTSDATDGVAATPKAVNDALTEAKSYADEIAEAASVGEPNVIEEVYLNQTVVTPINKAVYLSAATNLIDGTGNGSIRSALALSEGHGYELVDGAISFGEGTLAAGENQTVIGRWNKLSGTIELNPGIDSPRNYAFQIGDYNSGESVTVDISGVLTAIEKANVVSIELASIPYGSEQVYDADTIAGDCAYILDGDSLTIVYPDSETPVPQTDDGESGGESGSDETTAEYPDAYIWINVRSSRVVDDGTLAFVIGNGESESSRSNAFTVAWDGRTTIGASQDHRLVMGGSDDYAWIDCRDSSDVVKNNVVLYANGITKVRNLNAAGIIYTPNSLRIEHDGVSKGDQPSSENWKAVQFLNDGATALSTAGHAQRTGTFVNTILSSGNIVTQMAAYKPEANSTDYAQISVWYPYSGSPYIQLGAETRVSGVLHVNSGKALAIHNTDVTKGSSPSSTQYAQLHFMDNVANTTAETANRLASVRQYTTTAGTNVIAISAYKNDASVATSASLGVYYPTSGDPYVSTTAMIRTSNAIGTGGKTAWNDATNAGIWMTGASGQIHLSSSTADSGGSINFHFNKSANATSAITEPASGTLRISGPLRINGHSENIGYFITDTKNDVSLAAGGAGKTVTSLSLNVGRWVVIGRLTFPNASSATYIRGFLGTTNNSSSADDERLSINGYLTAMTISKIVDITTANTPYYLCASASVARTVSGNLSAIRIQ